MRKKKIGSIRDLFSNFRPSNVSNQLKRWIAQLWECLMSARRSFCIAEKKRSYLPLRPSPCASICSLLAASWLNFLLLLARLLCSGALDLSLFCSAWRAVSLSRWLSVGVHGILDGGGSRESEGEALHLCRCASM